MATRSSLRGAVGGVLLFHVIHLLLPKRLAADLRAEAGSAALKVIRRYLDSADEVFEISVSIQPADRFTFAMEMTRSRS